MPIGIGFIGAGNHARYHMTLFSRLTQARMISVYDLSPDAMARAQADFPPLYAVTRVEEMLADPQIEAVIIATPSETHRALTIAALEAGKHVLVEKPLAHNSEDALAIVQAAEAHPDCVVLVGHCERFNRAYIDARKAVDDGYIGTPRFASATRISPFRLNNTTWALGTLDTAIHDIDILLWLLGGKPISVTAQGTTVNPDLSIYDHVTYQICFENGALAQGHIGWVPFGSSYPMPDNAHPRLFLAGTKGVLSLDLWQRPVAVHSHVQDRYFWADDVLVGYGDYFTEVMAQDYAFLNAISSSAPLPITVRDAYLATHVAHAAHQSLVNNNSQTVSL